MLKKYIDYIIVIVSIILTSGASVLSSNINNLLIITVILICMFVFYKRKVDRFVVYLFFYWIFASYLSFFLGFGQFSIFGIIGSSLYFILPYFLFKVVGNEFWKKFENIVFKLTIITLPLFVLSVLFPSFFNSLQSNFLFLTNSIFYETNDKQTYYWYSFFFTYSSRGDFRNSGIMWEPGAFAMLLTIMIIYNWIKNGVKFKYREIIYSIAILTTLSTAGYISLSVLFIVYSITQKSAVYKAIIISFALGFIYFTYDLPFMSEKMNTFVADAYEMNTNVSKFDDTKQEANRVLSFLINFEQTKKNPIGYGILYGNIKDEFSFYTTINGIGEVMMKFGFLGLFLMLFLLYKFVSNNELEGRIIFSKFMMVLAIVIVFFSNPITLNPIFWIIVYTPKISRSISK